MGEVLVVDYLISMGLWILNCNWCCCYGELDVIVCDVVICMVVFVEVKICIGDGYGGFVYVVIECKVCCLCCLVGLWLVD